MKTLTHIKYFVSVQHIIMEIKPFDFYGCNPDLELRSLSSVIANILLQMFRSLLSLLMILLRRKYVVEYLLLNNEEGNTWMRRSEIESSLLSTFKRSVFFWRSKCDLL